MRPSVMPIVVNVVGTLVVALVAIGLFLTAWGLLHGGGTEARGCYVITDERGHLTYSTRPPQYNTQTGAVQFKTVDGTGWIFHPVRIDASDACVAAQPVEPTPAGG